MSSIFRRADTSKPTKINHAQINQSVLGYALPVVMGKGKVQQSLLWMDGFAFKKIKVNNGSSGGKGVGGGGKGGGTQYVYSADLIAALCNGPVTGVGDVWSNQSWLSNTNAAETWTIVSGSDPIYTPTNSGNMAVDLGVSINTSFSASYSDLGAGSPTTLAGSDFVAFRRVAFGITPNSGEYSIDGSNRFHFAPGDAGKTVKIQYSFSLGNVKEQQIDIIPNPSHTITIGTGTPPFSSDGGVIYYTGPNAGHAFTRVTSITGAGQYTLSVSSGIATYGFYSGDIGAEVLITYHVNNSAALPQGTPTSLSFTLFEGAMGQAPWATLGTTFPGANLGYTGIAYVTYGPMDLGYSGQIQQNVFEVMTADAYGGGIPDCSPVQCIYQVLTNPVWGLGAGAVPFPTSAIDNSPAGTWGKKTSSTARMADSTAWSWFAANGFFISPVIDKQDSAASLISRWLEAGACASFMSEGLFKLAPFGDTSTAGNGATWIAPSSFAAALDDTCFLKTGKNQDPVKISTPTDTMSAWNVCQVQWNNRANQYAPEVTPESDEAAINRYGKRIEDPQTWEFITTLPSATFAASMRVKRNVYQRNVYEFSLPYTYSYLEPMDVVAITTSSVWAAGVNNGNLALVNQPVRITKIVDNPGKEGLVITAEDRPFGVNQPTIYNKDLAAGQAYPNIFADPGNTEVVIFEAPSRLTGFQGNEIWIGACGSSADWGSCNVHVSQDGTTYEQIGEIKIPARLGVLASNLASGSDPDTTHSLVVNMVENSAALAAGTSADADIDNTLCFLGGELLSYSACSVTGQDQVTMDTYIRRGRKGSSILSHVAGELFVRLDDAIFKYTYDPAWAGKTVHFKFQSVNTFNNGAQDLSTVSAVSFTIPGQNPGTIDASSGLIIHSSSPFVGAGPLGWAPSA